jgi:hypothetical protein
VRGSDQIEISKGTPQENYMKLKIEVGKLTPETRWRLMRFAETFDKRQNTLHVSAESVGLPGSQAENDAMEREESPFDNELLECREALAQCPEPDLRDLLDQMDSGKILDRLQNKATRDEYDAAYHEMKRVEVLVVELGKRCDEYIKNLK